MDKVTTIGSMELCMNCGLCCSGALFSDAPVAEGEEEKADELGFTHFENLAGSTVFSLPCKHLSGPLCTIFPNRLDVCDSYHCDLTLDVKSEDVSIEDANNAVKSAKEQIAWLSENARYRNSDNDSTFNIRDYLHFFRKKMVEQLEEFIATEDQNK